MTLVLNEIYGLGPSSPPFIVAAADRRISNPDGSYNSTRRKLFDVPRLFGAVSYFGVAAFQRGSRLVFLNDWLPQFISGTQAADLGEFARELRAELSAMIPRTVLRHQVSGFHICGYDPAGRPDFWFLSNIVAMQGPQYAQLQDRYSEPASQFLGRDASAVGFDPSTGRAELGRVQIYRNGDVRVHVLASEGIDRMLEVLSQFPDFRRPTNPTQYGDYVRFKIEMIAYVYKVWAKRRVIARPIDVIVLEGPDSAV
jgi:hypothetical protein